MDPIISNAWRSMVRLYSCFVANGFYRNKTDFVSRHCVYSRNSKYPKIEKYLDEYVLNDHLNKILVVMKDNRKTVRYSTTLLSDYDRSMYRTVLKDRWDPFDDEPIKETGKLFYLMRKVVNSDLSRIAHVKDVIKIRNRVIIFYNFTYELDMLRSMCNDINIPFAEWNGEKHESLPDGKRWVYLVQYAAGCEGWNCITSNTIIFYSQNYSYRMTEQAAGRIDRINTPYTSLYYYHIRSLASIDSMIHRALKNKKNFNESSFLKGNRKNEKE